MGNDFVGRLGRWTGVAAVFQQRHVGVRAAQDVVACGVHRAIQSMRTGLRHDGGLVCRLPRWHKRMRAAGLVFGGGHGGNGSVC